MELNMRAQTQKVADQSSHHHSDAYAAERPTPPRMLAAAAAWDPPWGLLVFL